nr:hypothetical protein Iba_chr01dCG11340 [Ipomoea batatas]
MGAELVKVGNMEIGVSYRLVEKQSRKVNTFVVVVAAGDQTGQRLDTQPRKSSIPTLDTYLIFGGNLRNSGAGGDGGHTAAKKQNTNCPSGSNQITLSPHVVEARRQAESTALCPGFRPIQGRRAKLSGGLETF